MGSGVTPFILTTSDDRWEGTAIATATRGTNSRSQILLQIAPQSLSETATDTITVRSQELQISSQPQTETTTDIVKATERNSHRQKQSQIPSQLEQKQPQMRPQPRRELATDTSLTATDRNTTTTSHSQKQPQPHSQPQPQPHSQPQSQPHPASSPAAAAPRSIHTTPEGPAVLHLASATIKRCNRITRSCAAAAPRSCVRRIIRIHRATTPRAVRRPRRTL